MPGGFPTIPELANCNDIGTSLTNMGTQTTNGLNTPGAWAQLIAATQYDCVEFDISLFPSMTTSTSVAWDIGVGPAGSQRVIADKLVATSAANGSNAVVVRMPIAIPAGTRVAVRSSGNLAADATNFANMRLYDSGFVGSEGCAGADSIGFAAATTTGTTITAGNPKQTYGAYTQIIAATARDYCGFVLNLLNASDIDWRLFTLAIGPAGSEIPLIPNFGTWVEPINYSNDIYGPFYIPITAGTRLAAKLDAWYSASETVDVILHGLYK